jgi:hypothetical protein
MATEQLPLLTNTTDRLTLPADLPALRCWIDEAVQRCKADFQQRQYPGCRNAEAAWRTWPDVWVLRDLVAALSRASDDQRSLLAAREGGHPVDPRAVRELIAAVAAELER